MPERIARSLLVHVFHRVSAVVAMEREGCMRTVKVFDTEFGASYMTVPPEAGEVWLISNHPEGQKSLYEADQENSLRICRMAPQARVRVFICSEDMACREMELAEQEEL